MNPRGGTEILYENLMARLSENDLQDINIILSICHSDLIQKNKINVLWQHLSYDQDNVRLMNDRQFVDSIDYFVYVSDWQYEKFRQHFRIPEYKSYVLKNAIVPFEKHNQSKRKKLKLTYATTPWRGLNVLLESIRQLNEQRNDFEVDIFSSTKIYGDAFDQSEYGKYEELFRICEDMPNVNYKGYVTNEDIRDSLLTTDLYVYPSIFEETSCLSVIEAMSAGCHVVTTNLGALPETCGSFATMMRFQSNLQNLAKEYTNTLNDCMNRYQNNEYDEMLKIQSKYFYTYYSWSERIKQWKEFLGMIHNGR